MQVWPEQGAGRIEIPTISLFGQCRPPVDEVLSDSQHPLEAVLLLAFTGLPQDGAIDFTLAAALLSVTGTLSLPFHWPLLPI